MISNANFSFLRKYTTHIITDSVKGVDNQFYFSSLSYKTIAYKGMVTSGQLRPYFADLEHEDVVSALAVIHSRFSTNTFPSWRLAQPFPLHCSQRRDQHGTGKHQLAKIQRSILHVKIF
jgi:glutamate synthase domain-containing protein 1